jgi:hypothetical protein
MLLALRPVEGALARAVALAFALVGGAVEAARTRSAVAPLRARSARLEFGARSAVLGVRARRSALAAVVMLPALRPVKAALAWTALASLRTRPALEFRAAAAFPVVRAQRPLAPLRTALAGVVTRCARLLRFGGGAPARLLAGRRNALDGDRPPLAVVGGAALDAFPRRRRVGGDLRPEARYMLAPAFGR